MRPFDVNATIYEIKTIKIYFALSYEGWMSVAIVNLYWLPWEEELCEKR